MKDLNDIRVEIDEVDKTITELYEKRMKLAEEVAEYKIANGKAVYDKKRELEKLDTLASYAHSEFTRQGIVERYEQIMATSRKRQYQIMAKAGMSVDTGFDFVEEFDYSEATVCFQGVEGAYSQQAMNNFFDKKMKDSFHVDTWRDAMEAIKSGKAQYAVLPIENSSAGSIAECYDLILEYEVSIIGEYILKVDHALLGVKGAKLSDIKSVYSHPQALMQCDGYLRNNHMDWDAIALHNTAVSAKKVHDDNDVTQAAIGSCLNASIYDLDILEEAIQDVKGNETRFLVVSKNKKYCSSAKKLSLCIEIPNEEGSLYKMLSHFIFNGLDLCHIESRPIKDVNWEYRFFIDVIGNLNDEAVKNALVGIDAEASRFRILGNYVRSR